MFRGSIYFRLTPNGYIVDDFYRINDNSGNSKFNVIGENNKVLRVFGTFNFNPVFGQFCKKPHKLIDWSAK